MCGFFGRISSILEKKKLLVSNFQYRGPDNTAAVQIVKDDVNIEMGHHRLSIIDVSDKSNQPMRYKNVHLTFNGEIYNFLNLKAKLRKMGASFISNGDTEVILKGYYIFGEKIFDMLEGMFSIALYDDKKKLLFLARDRVGAKPLYFSESQKGISFGSELKFCEEGESFGIDFNALSLYFKFGYIPAPLTPYSNFSKVKAGNVEAFRFLGGRIKRVTRKIKFNQQANKSKSLKEVLCTSVESRLVSDVDVGLFLSGGVDSSLVAAICAIELGRRDIATFTIKFNNLLDESDIAKETASILGMKNFIIDFDSDKALEDFWDVFPHIDEPFADTGIIPSLTLCKYCKDFGKVFLSADGGDELFLGYNRYSNFDKLVQHTLPFHFKNNQQTYLFNKFIKRLNLSGSRSIGNKIIDYSSNFSDEFIRAMLVKDIENLPDYLTNFAIYENLKKGNSRDLSRLDFDTYLPDNLMFKNDRSSMLHSIEVREPLLSHETIDFAFSNLSREQLRLKGLGKAPLRNLLRSYLPNSLSNLPKRGFSPPLGQWFLENKLPNLERYLDKNFLCAQDLFNVNLIEKYFVSNIRKKIMDSSFQKKLWNYYILQRWLENKRYDFSLFSAT